MTKTEDTSLVAEQGSEWNSDFAQNSDAVYIRCTAILVMLFCAC